MMHVEHLESVWSHGAKKLTSHRCWRVAGVALDARYAKAPRRNEQWNIEFFAKALRSSADNIVSSEDTEIELEEENFSQFFVYQLLYRFS